MNTQSKTNRRVRWTLAGIALLLAYPLSIGPYALLAERGSISTQVNQQAVRFYRPLIEFAITDEQPLGNLLHSYMDWWAPYWWLDVRLDIVLERIAMEWQSN